MSRASDLTHSSAGDSLRLAQPASESQLGTLTRIVKAQVILLATNLTQDNYSKISVEIKTVSFHEHSLIMKKEKGCLWWCDVTWELGRERVKEASERGTWLR